MSGRRVEHVRMDVYKTFVFGMATGASITMAGWTFEDAQDRGWSFPRVVFAALLVLLVASSVFGYTVVSRRVSSHLSS